MTARSKISSPPRYPEIAEASPVYAQLRNCIDLLIAAAYMRQQDYYGRTNWQIPLLSDESALPTEVHVAPRHVPCNVNVVWKGNRLLSPAGGVSLLPHEALDQKRWQKDERGIISSTKEKSQAKAQSDWWWD